MPPDLVLDVMRLITDHFDLEGEPGATTDVPSIDDEDGWLFWWALRPAERNLLNALYELANGDGEAAAEAVAERLGVTIREIAGVLGPFNQRMRREGWEAMVHSRQSTTGDGRRAKQLTLNPAYIPLVAAHKDAQNPRSVRKPPRSRGRARQ